MKPEERFKLSNFFYKYYNKLLNDKEYLSTCHRVFINIVINEFPEDPKWMKNFQNLFNNTPQTSKLWSVAYFQDELNEDLKAIEFFLKLADVF